MNIDEFMQSLNESECPRSYRPHLQALWYDANGQWERAHGIVQELRDKTAARIHAYLHRKEGDAQNARYWHNRAGTVFPDDLSLDDEWRSLVEQLTAP